MLDFQRLTKIIRQAGYEPKPYSGRGMYGARCVGTSGDESAPTILATLAAESGDRSEAAEIIHGHATDALGKRWIVYWPGIEWQQPEIPQPDAE